MLCLSMYHMWQRDICPQSAFAIFEKRIKDLIAK